MKQLENKHIRMYYNVDPERKVLTLYDSYQNYFHTFELADKYISIRDHIMSLLDVLNHCTIKELAKMCKCTHYKSLEQLKYLENISDPEASEYVFMFVVDNDIDYLVEI